MEVHNHTDLSQPEIEQLVLVGINRNNWSRRTIYLYQHPTQADLLYTIGKRDDQSTVISIERLSESLNFRVALDYWKHGNKIYVRD